MKSIKRFLPVLLILALFLSLSACGKKPVEEGKPLIGIAWSSSIQDHSKEEAAIEAAGGVPVELPKITCSDIKYNLFGELGTEYVDENEMLVTKAAEDVKALDYSKSNVAAALENIDGVVFPGGADISPTLYREPQELSNDGEGIAAARDVSDYILMAYCIENDIPALGICRGMQMMAVVSGCELIQDIPTYYASLGVPYEDYHRMPVGDDQTFARHDIALIGTDTLLYSIIGSDTLQYVPSWHHQEVVVPEGSTVRVTATASCGGVETIEAIELEGEDFCVGVQFHPEADCGAVLLHGAAPDEVCDYDTCLNFFKALVNYSAA